MQIPYNIGLIVVYIPHSLFRKKAGEKICFANSLSAFFPKPDFAFKPFCEKGLRKFASRGKNGPIRTAVQIGKLAKKEQQPTFFESVINSAGTSKQFHKIRELAKIACFFCQQKKFQQNSLRCQKTR